MKELKIYKYLVIALVVVNIGVLLFFIIGRPGPPPPPMGPPPPLMQKMKFTGDKKTKFEVMEKAHHQKKRELMDERHKKYVELFKEIGQKGENREQLLKEIADLQYQTDKLTVEFFDEVAKLCTPEQKKELYEMIHHAIPGGPQPPPPPRGPHGPRP